ncbi:hypothetical protein TURU_132819 [Turdus rufiventris]|nr:hypothetical protein TURU_132819 [Turdus rufiventris]
MRRCEWRGGRTLSKRFPGACSIRDSGNLAPGTAGICSTTDSSICSTTDSGTSSTTDSDTSSTTDSDTSSTTDSRARPKQSLSFTCVPLCVTARTAQRALKGKHTALRATPVPGDFPTNSKVYFSHQDSLRGIHEKVSGQKLS